MMLTTHLPEELWGEVLGHVNWFLNLLPSTRINFNIPLLLWYLYTRIEFKSLLDFGATVYEFIFYPLTGSYTNLMPRSEFSRLVCMESDERLARVFVPARSTEQKVRLAEFHAAKEAPLPSVSSI